MGSKINILVVDDINTNILLLSELLKDLNINIITASSGPEALEKVSNMELSLALLDVQMPEMNGIELAICLNKDRSEKVPIIFVTATYPDRVQILEGYSVGAVDYIIKPFCSEILISKVRVFIRIFQQKKEIIEIASELSIITESLSKSNASLVISKEEYHTLLNASPDGILLVSLSGIITEISRSSLVLFGTNDRHDLIGKHFQRFITEGQTDKLKIITKQLNQEGLAQNVEFILRKKDKSCFPSEISVSNIERRHSTSLSIMVLVRDISKRKSIESQLIHSERLASLGEMASGMAHEINQPLNTISLTLDNIILEASKTESISKEYFEKKSLKMFENIQRIKNLIDHVRIFSRSNTEFKSKEFDVNQSIENALNLMNEQIRQIGISIHTKLTDGLPLYFGNMFELEQVLINFLSNARDSLMEKTQQLENDFNRIIEISSYRDENSLYIDIKDNGSGIKEKDKDRIFLPFFSTKVPGKGTGLGLSISFTIIKNMNGIINFESEEKKGSTFQIIFPIKKEQ